MSLTGIVYAVGAAITWGLVYTLDQRLLRNLSPLELLFINSLITTIILFPLVSGKSNGLALIDGYSGRVWLFVLASLLLAAIANLFIFSSIRLLGASTASVFEIAYPFFVVMFSYFVYRTSPNIYFIFGATLIFIGAAIIIRHATT